MIAALMLHALLVSALVTAAGAAIAPIVRSARRPTRFLWFGALLLAASWPVLQRGVTALLPAPAEPPLTVGARLLDPIVVGAAAPAAGWTSSDWLLAGWIAVSSLLALRLAIAALRLARMRRGWRREWIDGLAVRVAPEAGPAVVGFGRMEIVVPRWMLALDPALRLLALRHEEEHRTARDPWLLLTTALVLALLPWNLPLWWIARRLRLAIEMDCDARVLAHYPDARRYGRLLLLFAQRPGRVWPLAPALSESVTNLHRRIDAMTGSFRLARSLAGALGVLATLAVATACALRSPTNATNGPAPSTSDILLATPEGPTVMDANQTYFEFQVEKQAAVSRGVPPQYPAELRAAGTSGEVLMQFVVDTLGHVEVSSIKEMKTSDARFTAAVREVLPRMRFHAAEIGGRKVRQLVQMPFQFAVDGGAGEAGAPATVPAPQPSRTARTAPTEAPTKVFEFRVTRPATVLTGVPPRYPDELRTANIEGVVHAQFVVDTTGRADLGSFKVKEATHEAFVEAVKDALERMTFTPAEADGRKVRQLLQMPFAFSLSR